MRNRLAISLSSVLAVLALSTCGGGTTPTEQVGPGWLTLNLSTTATDAGGVLFTVRGGSVDSVRSSHPHVFHKAVGPLHKVAVVGDITEGAIAEIFVADRSGASYSVTVDQAAARTLEQRDVADYTITVGEQ